MSPAVAASSNTGAIVGGVIGGVAAVAVIALLAWYLLRANHHHKYQKKLAAEAANPWATPEVDISPISLSIADGLQGFGWTHSPVPLGRKLK